jgi:uncharacterized coiled-coil DUF342 family protein
MAYDVWHQRDDLAREVDRLRAELEDYKAAARSEAQIADEFKAERDELMDVVKHGDFRDLYERMEKAEAEREALLSWCDLNPEWYARAVAEMLRDGAFAE